MMIKFRRVCFHKSIQLLFAFFAGFIASFVLFSLDESTSTGKLTKIENNFVPNLVNIKENFDNHLLVILIFTTAKNIDRRDCIRETWIKLSKSPKVVHYFVIGTLSLTSNEKIQIVKENAFHHDLLLLPQLKDAYNNLTLKLLQSFKWLTDSTTKQIHFEYVLKVDDDSFVRLDLLYDELIDKHARFKQQSKNDPSLYWGFFDGRAHVKRKGPWTENNWFLCDRYLPYALGGGYLISRNLVQFVSNNFHLFNSYQSEDVSLGVWLAPLSIQRLHDIRFDTEFKSRGCCDSYLIQHKQSILDMKSKYKSLVNYDRLCPNGEIENRLVYNYNWNVLPSKCCARNVSFTKV